MVSAVVDTNVIVAGVLTANPTSASSVLLDRFDGGDFTLLNSPATLREIEEVLKLPRLRAIHELSDEDIEKFCAALEVGSRMFSGATVVSPAVTRDVTDTKWVALALEADADYLVTNDRRHLHRLRKVGRARIVTPDKFLRALDRRK